jgi:hypothetical protein
MLVSINLYIVRIFFLLLLAGDTTGNYVSLTVAYSALSLKPFTLSYEIYADFHK